MTDAQNTKAFEDKVASLIAATRHLDVPQILVLRRLTLKDPGSLRWASERQLNVVFNVIIAKALERYGAARVKEAHDRGFEPLLPPADGARDEDVRVLTVAAQPLLGKGAPSEAMATQAGFEALLAQRLIAAPPPRLPRQQAPIKEPPPLFAAQLGQLERGAKAQLAQAEGGIGEGGKPFTDFNSLFDDTLCNYARQVLGLFGVTFPVDGVRLPFMSAPDFAASYEDVLRRYVLPVMRQSRHVQTMATSYNWAEVGGAKLIEILQSGEVNNPILHNWDSRWNAFRVGKAAAKGKKPRPEDNPWPLFREDATRGNYEPPTEDDLPLLQDVVRFEIEAIVKCWREMGHLHQQEFNPNARQEQAREGALRDGIMKWVARLPEHVGEFLAIRAHFELQHCDTLFLRRLANNFGRTESERRRAAPFLCDFVTMRGG
jgi:hypothetical protein